MINQYIKKYMCKNSRPLSGGYFIEECSHFEIVICLNHSTFAIQQIPNSFDQPETDEAIAPVRNIDWL